MVEAAPDAGHETVSPPTMEAPTMEAPTMDTTMDSGGPSAAAVARARGLVNEGQAAIGRNDIDGAVRALTDAQRAVGRRHSVLRPLRSQLNSRGGLKVGFLLQQGNCPDAQRLYRSLRGVGADRQSRNQFGDWCRRP